MSLRTSQSVTVDFTTRNPYTGSAADADSTPTGTLSLNGTDNAATVTVTNKTTGVYKAAVTAPTLAIGDIVTIRISATVAGVTSSRVIFTDACDLAIDSNGRTQHQVGTSAGQINSSSGKVPATIAVGDIADNAITNASIAANAIGASNLQTNTITSTKIDNTVGDEIADAVWAYSGRDVNVVTVLGESDGLSGSRLMGVDYETDGYIPANAVRIGGTAQTGRDLGASVLISSGTGTGQLDVTSGRIKSDVTYFGGTAGTFSGGRPEVNTTHWGGTAVASALVRGNVIQWTGTNVATPDTAGYVKATIKSGTGTGELSLSSGTVTVGTLSNGVITSLACADGFLTTSKFGSGIWDGSAGGINANIAAVLGNAPSAVWPAAADIVSDGPITTSSGAVSSVTTVTNLTNLPNAPTDWLTAAAVKADAVTKIQSGLSTLTAAQVNDEADTALSDAGYTSARAGYLDKLNVTGTLAHTGNAASFKADVSGLLTTAGYTAPDNASITAIKAKTDNLPASPAAVSDIPTATNNADATVAAINNDATQQTLQSNAASAATNASSAAASAAQAVTGIGNVPDEVRTELTPELTLITTNLDAKVSEVEGGGGGSVDVDALIAGLVAGLPDSFEIVGPVLSGGRVSIMAGDAYTGSRAIVLTVEGWEGDDLDGETLTLHLLPRAQYTTPGDDTAAVLSVDADVSQTDTTLTITIEMTAEETAGLLPTTQADGTTTYVAQVVSDDVTVWMGTLIARRKLAGA